MKTTNTAARHTLALLGFLVLSACGGEGGSGMTSIEDCELIAGGNSTVTTSVDASCGNCSVSNADAAADGKLSPVAEVTVGPNVPEHDGVAIRATAQEGVVFPGGNEPRVYVSGGSGTTCVAIRTYLDGAIQEDDPFPFCAPSDGEGFGSRTTTQPFDAVEIVVTTDQTTGDASLGIAEICAGE